MFCPSIGDRSDHLAGHLVLQKASTLTKRGPFATVKTRGEDDFHAMALPKEIHHALAAMEVSVPSPIQQTAIEACLQKKDVLIAAPHGEGKTLAYLVPLFANMMKDRDVYHIPLRERRPRCILLAPTRETAEQLAAVCKTFDANTGLRTSVFTSRKRSAYHLSRMLKQDKSDVWILSPRVILKLIRTRRLFLDDLRYMVVDEADIMCSEQHDHEAVRLMIKIQKRNMYKHLWPVKTQFVFSTPFLTRKLEYLLARKFPELVPTFQTKQMHTPSKTAKQRFIPVRREQHKMSILLHLLHRAGHRPSAEIASGGMPDEELGRAVETFASEIDTLFAEVDGAPEVVRDEEDSMSMETAPEAGDTHNSVDGENPRNERSVEGVEEATDLASSQTALSDEGHRFGEVSTDSSGAHQASNQQRQHRYQLERVQPTSWGHLTTRAAPFTCHVPKHPSAQSDGVKRVIIFFRDIDSCTAVYHQLRSAGFSSTTLVHGALPFAVRQEMFRRFASGESSILCTTDILSRGIDVHVDVVIQFHMPTNAVAYLSRVGRVARMGRVGDSYALYTKTQRVIANAIQGFIKGDIPLHQMSNWSQHMLRPRYQEWRMQKVNAVSRAYVSMITTKTIPAHLERTYLRHNATWRPLYHPETVGIHGGVAPRQQAKIMERVTEKAVWFRKEQLARRKGGRAKFGRRYLGVWNDKSGTVRTRSDEEAVLMASESPATGSGWGAPEGPPR